MKAFKNFVNGEWVDASDGRTTAIINPSTGEQYAEATLSGPADVDAAIVYINNRKDLNSFPSSS